MPARMFAVTAALSAFGGALVAAPAAQAAGHHSQPKACHLVTDPAGDTQSIGPDDASQLDLVGGDFAMNRTTLTVVLRVKTLTAEDLTDPAGRIYEYDFTANGTSLRWRHCFRAAASIRRSSPTSGSSRVSRARAATGVGAMTGVLDLQHTRCACPRRCRCSRRTRASARRTSTTSPPSPTARTARASAAPRSARWSTSRRRWASASTAPGAGRSTDPTRRAVSGSVASWPPAGLHRPEARAGLSYFARVGFAHAGATGWWRLPHTAARVGRRVSRLLTRRPTTGR